jgi:uncharacterized protein (DUF849 family)
MSRRACQGSGGTTSTRPNGPGIGLALGGNARAGLEDTLYLHKGKIAKGHPPLVQRTADLARSLDLASASVDGTEKILSLPSR